LQDQHTFKEIYDKAIALLAQREHSRYELQNKLVFRGYDEIVIAQVMDQLNQAGLQSDQRFVESYVQMKIGRGYGPIRIQQELHDRGIDDDLIEKYLVTNVEIWPQLVATVRVKRFGVELPEDFKERARQMRFLQYRGFTTEQIKQGMAHENS
jgi:regulatory protein